MFIAEQTGFQYYLQRDSRANFTHRGDIGLHFVIQAAFQPTDIDHHVDFLGAGGNGRFGFESLGYGQTSTQREADNRAYFNVAFLQQVSGQRDITRVNANGIEIMLTRFFAQLVDLAFRGVHSQQGMVDIASVINLFSSHGNSSVGVITLWDVSDVIILTLSHRDW
ncbi:hypothetical protein D3C80_1294100 [compost metagenome]